MRLNGTQGAAQRVVAGVVALSVLAGCADSAPPEETPTSSTPIIIRDPGDFSQHDNRSHIHDYWNGATTLWPLNTTITLGDPLLDQAESFREVTLPAGSVVPSGASWVNTTVSWRSTRGTDKNVRMVITTPDSERKRVEPIPSDHTDAFPITENQTDLPHARTSKWLWRFELAFASNGAPYTGSAEITLSISISRRPGNLTPAPPHPDHWGPNRTLLLYSQAYALATPGVPSREPASLPQLDGIVPPGSRFVNLTMFYNSSTSPEFHYEDPRLSWRGADTWTFSTGVAPSTYRRQEAHGRIEWVLTASERNWDSPYANESAWSFRIDWSGRIVEGSDSAPERQAVLQGDFHFRITASK